MENSQTPTPSQPVGDEKTWGLFAHLSCVIGGWVLALVVYLTQKDKSAWIKGHATEALNWQLTMIIGYIIFIIPFVGWLVGLAAIVCNLVFGIQGAIKANSGGEYKYPFSIKFIK